jgi:hypothetical protein
MLKRIFLVFILISAVSGIAHLTKKLDDSNNEKINTPTVLEKQGDICAGIAENAVANLHAIIEFQKLELLARKANVMKRCMEDHGFIENPAWLTSASSLANQTALKLNISNDEALENLKKQDMYILTVRKDKPLYWKKPN